MDSDIPEADEFTDDNASNVGELEEVPENEREEQEENDNGNEEEYYNLLEMKNHAASLEQFQGIADAIPLELFDDIQRTIKLISADSSEETMKSVEILLRDYEKLKSAFEESKTQTSELMKRTMEMSAEMANSNLTLQKLSRANAESKETITSLKKELKKAWAVFEANTQKDLQTKDLITELKDEIAVLKGTANEKGVLGPIGGPGKSKLVAIQAEQEEELRMLHRDKKDLELKVTSLQNEVKGISSELEEEKMRSNNLLKEREYADEEMLTLKEYLAVKKSEHEREIRIREKAEQQLRLLTEINEKKEAEIKSKTEETKLLKEMLSKTEVQLQGEQGRCDKIENERDAIYSQHIRLQSDFEQQESENQMLTNKSLEQARKLKSYQEEIARLRENYKTMTKAKQALMKKHKFLDEQKVSAEMERDALRSVNSHLMNDLEGTKKELDSANKQIDVVTRERDIAQKNVVKSTTSSLKQYSVLKLSEQNKRNLEQEISGYKDEATKMRKLIYTLEKERDNRLNEINVLQQSLGEKNEEIKMKDNDIFDAKKKIIEFEKKSKEQQTLYENVRADRNVYSKNLLESQDEIMEMKRKLKIMNHQVEQLKEEISSRETILVKEHFEHSKLEKEKEALLLQIAKLQQQHEEAQKLIQSQQCEENKLRHVINEADHERIRQKKEFDAVVQERDILGTQLIRRNDELSLLYEKIKIQTSTLNKGEIQYRERLEDIRVLRLEIKKLRREKAMLQTETQNVDTLRGEIFKLQRECLKERTRVKVLEEELESPMNIHRWRKLSGSDPATFELITKIQTLQKRLIMKTEEVVEKELVIQQKEKLYTDIKNVLKRQPGPEIMEELQIARSAIKSKVKESKALASELNMYHSQVNEYKYDIEKLNKELQDLKAKYFQARKKLSKKDKFVEKRMLSHYPEEILNTQGTDNKIERFETPHAIKPNQILGPRFSGGGFNMSISRNAPISPELKNNDMPDIPDVDAASVQFSVAYDESVPEVHEKVSVPKPKPKTKKASISKERKGPEVAAVKENEVSVPQESTPAPTTENQTIPIVEADETPVNDENGTALGETSEQPDLTTNEPTPPIIPDEVPTEDLPPLPKSSGSVAHSVAELQEPVAEAAEDIE